VRRIGCIVGIAAALICVEGISANAAVEDFRFDPGTSFTFDDGGAGQLTGFFTINPPGPSFSGFDVIVTGGQESGRYIPAGTVFGDVLLYTDSSDELVVRLVPESHGLLLLGAVAWVNISVGSTRLASQVTGGATPVKSVTLVPEPSTWAMMLMGFAGLGWLAHARRRKTSAA
jgi:hypothetical protein